MNKFNIFLGKGKSLFTIFLIMIINHYSFSQNNTDKISIHFNDLKRMEIIDLIEQKTNYKFYFVEEWFDTNRISGKFDNVTIENILDELFEKTVINYYISEENKIMSINILITAIIK